MGRAHRSVKLPPEVSWTRVRPPREVRHREGLVQSFHRPGEEVGHGMLPADQATWTPSRTFSRIVADTLDESFEAFVGVAAPRSVGVRAATTASGLHGGHAGCM